MQDDDSPIMANSPSKPNISFPSEFPLLKPIPTAVTFQSELQDTFKLFNKDRTIDKWSSFVIPKSKESRMKGQAIEKWRKMRKI